MVPVDNIPGFVHVMDKPNGLQNWFEPLFSPRKAELDLQSMQVEASGWNTERAREIKSNAKIEAMFNLQYISKQLWDFLRMFLVEFVHNVFIFSFARVIANVTLK